MRVGFLQVGLLSLLTLGSCRRETAVVTAGGEELYAQHCASCHGADGQGVDEEYGEPLWGDKSVESLARYIHKSMPEDDEEAVVDEEATAVARYMHDAFYSPAAQARNRPPRVELLRMTNAQYRRSVADLVGSFLPSSAVGSERGLQGRYFNSEKMAKEKASVGQRLDARIDFDFGTGVPMEKMTQQGFSIRWSGSLLVPESGYYDLRLRTHNGALLHLNSWSGDREDSAFIDAYVSTGNALQEKSRRVYLLGGQAYPLALRYFSYQEKVSSIRLEWKPPHGVWEAIPNEALSPQSSPPVLVVQQKFSADDRSLGYERGSDVSREWHEATTYAALEAVNHIVTHLDRIAGGSQDSEKLREFCLEFAGRAFRRPLTPEQADFFVSSRFEEDGPELAIRNSLLLVLTSPRFLYPGLVDQEGEVDGYTVASRLALGLWDSLPDAALRQAAAEGRLSSTGEVAAEARRLMGHPRTREKMASFFQHWLAMDEREDLGKDADLYPDFGEEIVADLRHSLERFVEDVVWSDDSDYRDLLRADYLYLNPRLARYYGAPVPESGGFEKAALLGEPRSGIFTHPYLLAANAYHDNTSPIHRGVFLSRNVLGRLLKPPPEAVAFKNEEFDADLTMREKVTELTKEESCMQCHRVINPIGFSLENFDAVGRYRTEENSRPINTVSDYVDDHDESQRVESAGDLAELALGSRAAHRAFVTHLFHHVTKQSTAAYGEDTLEILCGKFTESGYNIRELVVEILVRTALAVPALDSESPQPSDSQSS